VIHRAIAVTRRAVTRPRVDDDDARALDFKSHRRACWSFGEF